MPVARFPEAESLHLIVVISHRRVAVWRSMKVQIDQFLQVCSYDLISIDENHLFEVHWEEDVKEEDFIGPYDALLLLLRS